MTSKHASQLESENPAPDTGAGFFMRLSRLRRKSRRVLAIIFPQWLKTLFATFVWLGVMVPWVSVTTIYAQFGSGVMTGVGMALFAGIAGHVWPTRTPPWRTVVIVALFTAWLGSTLLLAGLGAYGLTITGLAGSLLILMRINENGRKVVRALLRRPLATKV
jgi:hypothetical protein